MKKLTTLLILCTILNIIAKAQIPNGDFETWNTTPGYASPDSWDNMNSLGASNGIYTCEKGTTLPAHGSSFMILTSRICNAVVVPGLAVCGKVDMVKKAPTSGFAFSGRPASLTGKYACKAAAASDYAYIGVWLIKWNMTTNKRDTIASKYVKLDAVVTSWKDFDMPLTYTSTNFPDSALIALSASGTNPVAGSYLYIDNLAFAGFAANVPTTTYTHYNTTIYPNPAKDNISIDFGMNITSDVHVLVTDIMGKTIKDVMLYAGQQIYPVQMDRLSPGTYYLKMQVDNDVQTKRILVQ